MTSERIDLLGCPVDNISMDETLKRIDEIIHSAIPVQHVVVNVDKILKIRRDEKLYNIVNHCAIINVDGMPLVWISRLFGKPLKERVAGIDLMERLVEHAAKRTYRIFFLGAEDMIVKKVIDIYTQQYQNLAVAGFHHGYWAPAEEQRIVQGIKESKADILFVAMSSPRKEEFINQYLTQMNTPFVMGVGGSFDIVAGKTKRAPQWMQYAGLEWLFRLFQEPRRMWRRYLVGNVRFVLLVVYEYVRFLRGKFSHA